MLCAAVIYKLIKLSKARGGVKIPLKFSRIFFILAFEFRQK